MPSRDCPPPPPASWRRYPFQLGSDPQFVFPAAEGHQGAATDTYYASGILRGAASGRRYAFLTIFAKNEDILDLLSADLHVLALFDLDTGRYDTGSRFDLPPARGFNAERINVTRGRLDVRYESSRRSSRMWTRTDADGALYPFAYAIEVNAEARSGIDMALRLCADALKPPQAVGGAAYGGRITVYGQPNTCSYFQPLRYAGTLRWGPIEEDVAGATGWLDRQWFPDFAGRYAGALADRYGHQWAQISLDNGWEFSLWRQFRRRRRDLPVMFSGVTATDPSGGTSFADDATTDILTYVRDPGLIEPLLADAQRLAGRRTSIRYFFDAFRLRAPSLDLDLISTPLVAAPAHQMPIDYFSGPTRIEGTMRGRPVAGYGFHERTLPLSTPRQLVIALRDSLLRLPAAAVGDAPLLTRQLAEILDNTLRDVQARRCPAVRATIQGMVRPALLDIAESHRTHLLQIADDLVQQLTTFA
jgi:predicted secreted hydrolase